MGSSHNAEVYLLPDGRAAVRPLGYLGHQRFAEFREGCADGGFTYDRAVEVQCGPVDRAHDVFRALRALGLKVRATRALVDAMPKAPPSRAPHRSSISPASPEPAPSLPSVEVHIAQVKADYARRGLPPLYRFQEDGVRWLSGRSRALYADEMGLGKTISALSAVPYHATGVLVVCPAHLKGVWRDEARKWRPDLELTVLQGGGSFRWPRLGEILVVNYDVLPGVQDKNERWRLPPEFQHAPACLVICDEAHYVKSTDSQRAAKFRELSKAVLKSHGRVFLLTGTPLIGTPMDLWNVLRAGRLELEAFGSYPRFCELFDATPGRFGMNWGIPDASVPDRLRRVMMRRLRRDVLPDLPEKSYRTLIVDDIDRETRNICDETIRLLAEAGVELTPSTSAADLRDNPLAFGVISAARTALAAAKIPYLVKVVEEYEASNEPLVVFSHSRAPVDVLAARRGWASITGDITDHEERADIARRFREGEFKGIALTFGSGGTGLTLCGGAAAAAHMVICSRPWSPTDGDQGEDRLARIGQTRGVLITDLIADHIVDRRLWEILTRKRNLIDATLADEKYSATKLPESESK